MPRRKRNECGKILTSSLFLNDSLRFKWRNIPLSFCQIQTMSRCCGCREGHSPRVVGWHRGDVPGQGWKLFTFSPSLVFGQVLSHNLYTVLCIPHDPVALEEHFRDDDDGPVSSQGYMPYLNKYILDKVSPLGIPLTCCVSGGDTTVPGLLLHPVAAPRLHSPLLLEIPCLDGWKKDTEGWEALR